MERGPWPGKPSSYRQWYRHGLVPLYRRMLAGRHDELTDKISVPLVCSEIYTQSRLLVSGCGGLS